ncbi:MAG: cytochrome c [Alphaproteobacteria bacterium]|nr:cytochrome c [Alphaproteobacteria bacterium]
MNNRKTGILAVVLIAALVIGIRVFGPNTPSVPDGQPMAEVTVPELTGVALEGQAVFTANCSACHGVNATGLSGLAPPLVSPIYRPAHHADIAFILAPLMGVRAHHWTFGSMPPVPGVSEADLKKVTVYIRELQRANGVE